MRKPNWLILNQEEKLKKNKVLKKAKEQRNN